MQKYKVKTTVLPDGERLASLICSDGMPVFWPTVYSVSELRGRNFAFTTISNYLRALIILELFLKSSQKPVCLDQRLEAGCLLSLSEVESLSAACRWRVSELNNYFDCSPLQESVFVKKRLMSSAHEAVSPQTVSLRLQVIRDYLAWRANVKISSQSVSLEDRKTLSLAIKITIDAFSARLPGHRYARAESEGLDDASIRSILSITDPQAESNPWSKLHVRVRNALIIRWLYHLGLRRGELLNVQVSDIDFAQGTVSIVRRPDQIDDPRRYQPAVKTRGRVVPLSTGMLDLTREYVVEHRSNFVAARKHNYLFVSETGAPLSIAACAKIFNVLRSSNSQFPENLSPHVFRHTWNDQYSREMDERKVPEDTEKKTRAYLMGWSPSSDMPSVYTKRHVRKKARKASVELQEKLVGDDSTIQ